VFVQGRPPVSGDTNSAAVWSLVLGLLGVLLLLPTAGVLSLPVSVGAWITAVQARRRIDAGVTTAGEGMARAGKVLGIIGVVAAAVVIIALIVLIATGFDFEEFQRDLERDLEQRRNANAVSAVLGR
jgi:hypothetical protein